MLQDPNAKVDMSWKDGVVKNRNPKNEFQENNPDAIYSDPNVQSVFGVLNPDTTDQNFDGTGANNGVCPPDPAGDVGPNHYVQMLSTSNIRSIIKSGVKLLGPFNTKSDLERYAK